LAEIHDTEADEFVSKPTAYIPSAYMPVSSHTEDASQDFKSESRKSFVSGEVDPTAPPAYPTYPDLASPPKNFRHVSPVPVLYRVISIAMLISTVFMWVLCLTVNVMHRLPVSNKYSQTFTPLPAFFTNPASLAANMPATCVNYLKSSAHSLVKQGLFVQMGDRALAALFDNVLFGVFTLSALHNGWLHFKSRSTAGKEARMFQTVKGFTAVMSILLPAIVFCNVIYMTSTVFAERAAVNYVFTVNPSQVGNCTFITVGMDKRFGYFDIKEGLALRIADAALAITS
jgi:hypothetical protein